MQPIERYGVIALVLLLVTVAAVILWERDRGDPSTEPAAETSSMSAYPGSLAARADASNSAAVRPRPRPLRRDVDPSVPALGTPADFVPVHRAETPPIVQPLPRVQPAPRPLPRTITEVPPEPKVVPSDTYYVVESGDTLSEIAERELGSSRRWKEIVALNPGLDPNRMRENARLKLPAPGPAASSAAGSASTSGGASPAVATDASKGSYVVREGDSLWIIAARTLGDGARWVEIQKVNQGLDADHLEVGKRLTLPAGASSAAAREPERVAASQPSSPRRRGGVVQ